MRLKKHADFNAAFLFGFVYLIGYGCILLASSEMLDTCMNANL